MERPDRRRALPLCAGLSLFCLVFTGCLQVPFCIPEINYAPSIATQCKGSEVYAFRVDVTQRTEIAEERDAVSGKVTEYEALTRLRTSADGTTSAQMGLTFSTGWRYVGVVNFTASSTEHGISVRLYRRGYETIVLKPGENVQELHWTEARDLNAQVKAIDDLMHPQTAKQNRQISARRVLEPGTKSAAQGEALRFGASEYERVARELLSPSRADAAARRDLLEEASRLRALAEGNRDREP